MGERTPVDDLRSLLERQVRTMRKSVAGVVDGTDPEDLHRFRVATRRSRALIRAARPLIRDQLTAVDRELRWLGRASGAVRDLDVLIAHVRRIVEHLAPDQAGGSEIVAALEHERLEQREVLLRVLASERFGELLGRFEEALAPLEARDGDVSLAHIAEQELDRLRSSYEALGDDPPDDELHAVRIKAKHARYAAELAARSEGEHMAGLAEALRDMQDLIGAHQDAVVAEQRVRAVAADGARIAAGRIVEMERRRRVEIRAQVPAGWKRIERAAAKTFADD